MTTESLIEMALYVVVLGGASVPLGLYMAAVYEGRRTWLSPVLVPVEQFLYRVAGIRKDDGMDWRRYAAAVLVFSFLGLVATYLLQRAQGLLPLNPASMPGVSTSISKRAVSRAPAKKSA